MIWLFKSFSNTNLDIIGTKELLHSDLLGAFLVNGDNFSLTFLLANRMLPVYSGKNFLIPWNCTLKWICKTLSYLSY